MLKSVKISSVSLCLPVGMHAVRMLLIWGNVWKLSISYVGMGGSLRLALLPR